MTGFKSVNLLLLAREVGEENVKSILSNFSCPLNADVEYFLKNKALVFAKQGWAQTHLVFASYRNEWVLVGYFSLANKDIRITSKFLKNQSANLKKRISKFATFDRLIDAYFLSAPLIAQIGKNYKDGYDKLITGDELLAEACDKVCRIQLDLGGRFVYLECEDKGCLIDFYTKNGFCDFNKRALDLDETDKLHGKYLIQMLKYIHQ